MDSAEPHLSWVIQSPQRGSGLRHRLSLEAAHGRKNWWTVWGATPPTDCYQFPAGFGPKAVLRRQFRGSGPTLSPCYGGRAPLHYHWLTGFEPVLFIPLNEACLHTLSSRRAILGSAAATWAGNPSTATSRRSRQLGRRFIGYHTESLSPALRS